MNDHKVMLPIYGNILKWARTTCMSGIEQAAIRIGVSQEMLLEWESKTTILSLRQIKKIAKVYKRSVTVIMLKTTPKSLMPPKYRKIPDMSNVGFQEATFMAIRQAQEIQINAIDLILKKNNLFVEKLLSLRDKKGISQSVCEMLGITEENRFKSKNSTAQLTKWKRLLERQGIITLELKYALDDSRAFCLFNKTVPVIVLNSTDTDNARIFSLFHELGHIIKGQTDIDDNYDLTNNLSDEVEIFCNHFAASLLVPYDLLSKVVKNKKNFTDDFVLSVARTFKVSKSVVWRRLMDGGYITQSQFNDIKNKLHLFEPFASLNPKKRTKFMASKKTHLYLKLKRKSEFFVSEVFQAYNENRISQYDVLRYIGIKSVYLEPLQRIMFT